MLMLWFLYVGFAPVFAATPPGPAQVFDVQSVQGITVDYRGTKVAYTSSIWRDGEDRQAHDLWVLDTKTQKSTRLTFSLDDVHAPVIAPDARYVYFLAGDEEKHDQVWRIGVGGGQAAPLTHEPEGVAGFELSADVTSLYFTIHKQVENDDDWRALREAWPAAHSPGRTHSVSILRKLDLQTWRTQNVWEPDRYVVEMAVSPDQAVIAAIVAPDSALGTYEGGTQVRLFDVRTGEARTVPEEQFRTQAPSPYGWLLGLAWSSDSRSLAFRIDFDGYPGEVFVLPDARAGRLEVTRLSRPHEVHPEGSDLMWVPGRKELCYRAADHAYARLVCTDPTQSERKSRVLPSANVVVQAFAWSGDGRDVIALIGTESSLTEIYRLPARGNLFPERLSDLNPHTEDWEFPQISVVHWKAPDGAEVEGVLELPASWKPSDGALPTLVLIHGGPTAHVTATRSLSAYGRGWLASKGFAVWMPNYRGSTGYGDAFLTDLVGREHDIETADILAGVDALVAQGVADPERLAVSGWSNGGFLTASVITKTTRFKAAILGAGVVDQTLQWALEDTPNHVVNFMQGLPWEQVEAYKQASPLYAADQICTPVLIHVGGEDARVPPAHALALYRALDTYLQVPVELRIYDGAGHGLSRRSQLEAKMAWDWAWLQKWIPAKTTPDTDAQDR